MNGHKFIGSASSLENDPHSYNYKGYSLPPRFGIFAKVIPSGMVKNGDEVELLKSAP